MPKEKEEKDHLNKIDSLFSNQIEVLNLDLNENEKKNDTNNSNNDNNNIFKENNMEYHLINERDKKWIKNLFKKIWIILDMISKIIIIKVLTWNRKSKFMMKIIVIVITSMIKKINDNIMKNEKCNKCL